MGNARPWTLRRGWSHKFPLVWWFRRTGGLSATLDSFKQDGWTTMKSGIGRTRVFADTLLQHRMEVVVVPEPPGRTAAKSQGLDWKDVRKKLEQDGMPFLSRTARLQNALVRCAQFGLRAASRGWEGKACGAVERILRAAHLEAGGIHPGRIVYVQRPSGRDLIEGAGAGMLLEGKRD